MECANLNKGSYKWRSIINAKHVIKLGRVWRVGNGEYIQIRGDRWLPQISSAKVLFPVTGLALDERVCDIIDQDSHTWRAGLIERIPITISATMVEALACRRALNFAKELNLMDTVFKGDAEQIIKALLAKEMHQPEYGHVLQDSLVLASEFRICMFTPC